MSNTDPIKLPENRDAFLARAFAEPDGVVSAGVPTPTPPATANPMQCDCLTWGSDNMLHSVLGNGHHERCPHHVPHVGALDIIRDLVRGMEEWAHDEDGVHPGAWDAYKRTKSLLGEPVKEEE